jgi:hypothetical protein
MKTWLFALKYLFRTLHMGSFGLIFGNLLYDFLFGQRLYNVGSDLLTPFLFLNIIAGITLMLSGLVNMIILTVENKYNKTIQYEFWKKLLIFKFLVSLSVTPLLEKIISDKEICFKIRTAVFVGLFVISPFLRYFREAFLIPTKAKKDEYEMVAKTNKD